jgi:hypothetical protein
MYVPLRKGLREIREIILTPKDVNGEEIKKIKRCCCISSPERGNVNSFTFVEGKFICRATF